MNPQNSPTQEEIDPRLEALIQSLRPTPRRDPEAVARGRIRFEQELEILIETQPEWRRRARPILGSYIRLKEKLDMFSRRYRFAYTTLAVLIALLAILFGGASVTAFAAQNALPGDALYSVKTGLESTQVRLADDISRVRLHLGFAERRLDEISRLIAEGRHGDIKTASAEFVVQIHLALESLNLVAANDPAAASELAGQITAALSRFANVLSGMLAQVPDTAKPVVEQALNALQSIEINAAGELEFTGLVEGMQADVWTIAGHTVRLTAQTEVKGQIAIGDLVKVHAAIASDGSLTAREIELVQAADVAPIEMHGDETRFTGVVESISSGTWVVSGITLLITPQTDIRDMIMVGDLVEVRAITAPDGALIAVRLRLSGEVGNENNNENHNENNNFNGNENTNDNENDNEDDNDDIRHGGETRFTGVVESISAGTWVVSGVTLLVTPQTDIRDMISVGDLVEVRAITAANGALIAVRLRLSGEIDNENHNFNGNENTNDNENNNSGSNSGPGSGGNDNENDNSGSNSGPGSDGNDNEDDWSESNSGPG